MIQLIESCPFCGDADVEIGEGVPGRAHFHRKEAAVDNQSGPVPCCNHQPTKE